MIYVRRGLRYLPLVLACAIIAGAASYAVAKKNVSYTADSTVAVSPGGAASQLVTGISNSAADSSTYVETQIPFATSETVIEDAALKVERQLHAPLASYNVTADEDSQTLTAAATSKDRAVAAATANAIIDSYESQAAQQQNQSLASAITQVRSQIAGINSQLHALGSQSSALAQAQQSADSTRLGTADSQLEALLTQQGVPQVSFTAIVTATPGSATPSSTTKLGLLGLVLGLAVAVLVAVSRELALGFIKDADAVLLATPEAKVLGRLPTVRRNRRGVIGPANRVVDQNFDESLRRLRVRISLLSSEPVRTILIASPERQDGRTFIAANLAVAWARTGRRVLLVAGDLRHRDLVSLVGAEEGGIGLTDLLSRTRVPQITSLDEAVHSTAHPNLSFVGPGTVQKDSEDLFESDLLETLVDVARKRWDVVIFDSAPLLQAGESALLASKVDSVILVASVGRTRMKNLRAAIGLLRTSGVEEILTVANREDGDPAAFAALPAELIADEVA